jgi:hypothetical protein
MSWLYAVAGAVIVSTWDGDTCNPKHAHCSGDPHTLHAVRAPDRPLLERGCQNAMGTLRYVILYFAACISIPFIGVFPSFLVLVGRPCSQDTLWWAYNPPSASADFVPCGYVMSASWLALPGSLALSVFGISPLSQAI